MKCYYEVLGIPRDATEEDIKKSYRRLALAWHPDKNPDNLAQAKVEFQLIQQAYEVLKDSHERAWYDKHRETILRGGANKNYEDNSVDLFKYFTSSCYEGFNDDSKSFYSVYRELFNIIAAEESGFHSDSDSDFEIPGFGGPDSSFDDVVHPFYSYWQSFTTKKSYSWLNVYNINEAPNRKVFRLMEKENKKVRDEAKKERNEEVRALVRFVKRRDKRVQAQAQIVKEKKEHNLKKFERQRQIKLKERREELATHQMADWSKFSNLEKELKDIEDSLSKEFGDLSESENGSAAEGECESSSSKQEALYCVACNKLFKTPKAFQNHENSKKHKENASLLMSDVLLNEDNADVGIDDETSVFDDTCPSDIEGESGNLNAGEYGELDGVNDQSSDQLSTSSEIQELDKSNKKSKKVKNKLKTLDLINDNTTVEVEDLFLGSSKRQRKKQSQRQLLLESTMKSEVNLKEENDAQERSINVVNGTSKNVKKKNKKKKDIGETTDENVTCSASEELSAQNNDQGNPKMTKYDDISKNSASNTCANCKMSFTSKNKLFEHLKSSGHATYLSSSSNKLKELPKSKRNKKM